MLKSELLSCKHAFFTREGGVSEGIYAGLNCGPGSGDRPEHVAENRMRAMQRLGATSLCTLYQIHSPDVLHVTAAWQTGERPQADAMVTATPGVMLGILTADCAPVLFADTRAGVIGAAHAGWKGAVGGVLGNTVAAMEKLGAARQHIAASVGPCIRQPSYEVGAEFVAKLLEESAENERFFCSPLAGEQARHSRDAGGKALPEEREKKADPSRFVLRPADSSESALPQGEGKKYYFDLPGYVKHKLQETGLTQVDILPYDTYPDEQRFFSFRRTTHRGEKDYGRQLSAIMLSS